jgi:hypothetical protein
MQIYNKFFVKTTVDNFVNNFVVLFGKLQICTYICKYIFRMANTNLFNIPDGAVENWKVLPNYDNKYLVSDYGRVRSMYNNKKPCDHLMTPKVTKAGYYYYNLYKRGNKPNVKSWGASRLVAMMFLPTADGSLEVSYKDGNKTNLHVNNLIWLPHTETIRKSQGFYYRYYNIKNPNEIFFARSRRQVGLAIGQSLSYYFKRVDMTKPNRNGWMVERFPLATSQRFDGF